MLLLLTLAVHLQSSSVSTANPKLKIELSYQQIELWLKYPLSDLPYLHLKVANNSIRHDLDNVYVQWFLEQTKLPITVSTYTHIQLEAPLENGDRDNYAILTQMQHLRMDARQFGQRAGIYFFIVTDIVDMKELRDLLHAMWTTHLIFRNFILTNEGVLIYDPFELDSGSSKYGRIVKYDGVETVERMLFSDMRGYPLRVQIFDSVYAQTQIDADSRKVTNVGGVDGQVAHLLQERLNFTMELQYPNPDLFGERLPNGTFIGVLGAIINNEVDVCLTGFFVKDYLTNDLAFSVGIYEDKLCIYTPKAKRIPEYILPIFAVEYEIWLIFISSAFLCSIIWLILRNLNLNLLLGLPGSQLNHSWLNTYYHILCDTWVLWVRVCLNHYPVFSSEKIFVASLCLVSVIFGAMFESSLATVHMYPFYFKDINTLQELDESGLLIHYKFTSMADDLFFNETSPLFANLHKKLVYVKNQTADILEEVAEYRDKAGVTRYNVLMTYSMHLLTSKQIWVVPECPKYYLLSYVWAKESPWETTFNRMLSRMSSGGLIQKFIGDMQIEVDLRIMREHLYESNAQFKALALRDFQLAFYIILLGSSLSAICLLIEKHLIRQKSSKNQEDIMTITSESY